MNIVTKSFIIAALVIFVTLRLVEYLYVENHLNFDDATQSQRRANAVILVLCRNSDLQGMLTTLKDFERTFNARFNYPYVFLNDKPFSDEFKQQITQFLTRRNNKPRIIQFGRVPVEHWSYPSWIDQEKAARCRQEMALIPSGGLESYRHMCRFFSGFFYKHPLLLEYDYYWRIEPDTHFHCRVNEDPFLFMMDNKIEYGFEALLHEQEETVVSLWPTTQTFIKDNLPKIQDATRLKSTAFDLLMTSSDIRTANWTFCYFWNNFEIANFAFFRSELYQRYFDYLDKSGGFFYERWGDAPVRTLAVAMFLNASQIHHFSNMGYQHGTLMWCPKTASYFSYPCSCGFNEKTNLANPQVAHWWPCNSDFVNKLQAVKNKSRVKNRH